MVSQQTSGTWHDARLGWGGPHMQPSQGSTLSQVHSRKHWLPRCEKKLQSSCCLDRRHLLLGTRTEHLQAEVLALLR